MRPVVLVLTHGRDHFVPERVLEAVDALGGHGVRVNTEDYPHDLDLELRVGDDGARVGSHVDVRGVYLRRLAPPTLPDQPPEVRRMVAGEARLHWAALGDVLDDARWVNPPEAEARVEGHKLRQLRRARAAGLRVPETLVTSDPEAARAFAARHGHDVVVKLLGALSHTMDGQGTRMPTTPLGADDLEALDGLRSGPLCLQPRLVSTRELRVVWVDGEVFVGAVDTERDAVDWRSTAGRWRPHTLDDATRESVDRLMRDLGLTMGALDLLLPADGGAPWFLEVNPSGEWGMLEAFLELPVSRAVARCLLGEAS